MEEMKEVKRIRDDNQREMESKIEDLKIRIDDNRREIKSGVDKERQWLDDFDERISNVELDQRGMRQQLDDLKPRLSMLERRWYNIDRFAVIDYFLRVFVLSDFRE